MEVEKSRSNIISRGVIAPFCTLLAIYFVFFVNIISVSAKTVKAEEISPNTYILTLQERGGITEQIKGSDINLKYSSEEGKEISYDDTLLQERINKLSCFDNSNTVQSQNAGLIYANGSYVISRGIYGNKVNKNVLYENIVQAIKSGNTTLNLESINCYESGSPIFTENSPEVINARDTLNKYVSSKITYNVGGITQVLDGSIIKDWISVDGNMQVILDEAKVRNYVNNLANTYTKSLGTSIKVSGGYNGNNHGWTVDRNGETSALIYNIKNGQAITKGPMYSQTSSASYFKNVGDTFVEIDMNKQHLWFYKNGYLIVEGDVVTGNVSAGNATPAGVYKLYYKQKDTVLRGPGYAAPVSFWMPFVNNIGVHDASWRSEFGGEIYKTDGSHGCVNAPYYVAKAVYDNISSGTTVICYN